MITAFKFHWKKEVGEELWKLLWNFVKNNFSLLKREYPQGEGLWLVELNSNFLILPVPLHFFKKIKRWFNQSEILAKSIWQTNNINYSKKVLKRRKNTIQQSLIKIEERLSNLDNAFKISKRQVDNIDKKTVFLVDDVVTTWTTLNEIAKVLKQNWAKKVIWICLASN
jgi:ComF family protein